MKGRSVDESFRESRLDSETLYCVETTGCPLGIDDRTSHAFPRYSCSLVHGSRIILVRRRAVSRQPEFDRGADRSSVSMNIDDDDPADGWLENCVRSSAAMRRVSNFRPDRRRISSTSSTATRVEASCPGQRLDDGCEESMTIRKKLSISRARISEEYRETRFLHERKNVETSTFSLKRENVFCYKS